MNITSNTEQKLLDAILSLDKKVDSLDTKIDSLDKKVDSLGKKVEVQFAELRGEIKRIDTRIDGIDKRLDSLETQVKSQDNRLWVMVTGLFIALFAAIARTWFFPNT